MEIGPGAKSNIAVGTEMRVLMIHNRYLQRGGEDKSFESEAALLREMGCTVFTNEESNERTESLGNLRVAARSVWSSETYGNIRKQLRKNRSDILHVQNYFPLISPSAYCFGVRDIRGDDFHVGFVCPAQLGNPEFPPPPRPEYRWPRQSCRSRSTGCPESIGAICAWPGNLGRDPAA